MTVSSIAPTPGQWASAALHLERRDDWRYVRIGGTRYAVVPSGTGGHVYQVRGDAAGCSCPRYLKTGRPCSHMLSLELAALEAELAEAPAPERRVSYADLFEACRDCGDVADSRDGLCDRCASNKEWEQHRAGQRELVATA